MEKKEQEQSKNKKKQTRKTTLEDTQTKLKKIESMAKEIKTKNNVLDKDEKANKENHSTKEKNKIHKKNKIIKLGVSEFVYIIVIILLISILIGYKIGRKDTKEIVLDKDLQQFIDVYSNIKENYYDETESESLISNAINGMINGLDNYSLYFDENSANTFNAKLAGEYEGIGLEIIGIDNKIIVYNVFKDSPAEKVGIKVGDELIKIDGDDVTQKSTSEISQYIRENGNEKINIDIKRKDKEINFELKRENVVINTVTSNIFEKNDKKIGYIYIGIFSNIPI